MPSYGSGYVPEARLVEDVLGPSTHRTAVIRRPVGQVSRAGSCARSRLHDGDNPVRLSEAEALKSRIDWAGRFSVVQENRVRMIPLSVHVQ